MKTLPISVGALALALAACSGGPAELPADPVQRAATCGVVAAAEGRAATADIKVPLSAERQGAVLRYALLAGAEGEEFSRDRTAAVVDAMPPLGESLSEKSIETLGPQCTQAYPVPATPVELPDDPLTVALGCDELSEFMRQALGSQGAAYKNELDRYYALNQALDRRLAPLLGQRGFSDVEASQPEARKAMAAMVKLGQPTAVLDACIARYVEG